MSTRSLMILALAVTVGLVGGAVVLLEGGGAPRPERVDDEGVTDADVDTAASPADSPGGLATARPPTSGAPTEVEIPPAAPEDTSSVEPEAPPPTATGRITGRLLDTSGEPAAGEPVDLRARTDAWDLRVNAGDSEPDWPRVARVVSDADGSFVLPALPGAEHVLFAGGRRWARTGLQPVSSGDDLVITLQRGRELAGVVVSKESGDVVPDATVVVLATDQNMLTVSDADGEFRLGPVPKDISLVGAYAPGFGIGLSPPDVPDGEQLVVALPEARPIVGQIVDRETLKPVADAQVQLVLEVDARVAGSDDPSQAPEIVAEMETVTATDGSFEFASGPTYGFEVRVTAPQYVPHVLRRYTERGLGDEEEIVVQLRPLVGVSGMVVRDDSQSGAAGVRVVLEGPEGDLSDAVADADGHFELSIDTWDGVGPLSIRAAGGDGWFGREPVHRVDDDGIVVTLMEPLDLEVEVVSGGETLSGAHVAVLSPWSLPTLAVTGSDGRARVRHPVARPAIDTISVAARYGLDASLPLEVSVDDARVTSPIVLDVDRGAWITGRVTDAWGTPVVGALVRGVSVDVFARSDGEGSFRVGPMEPGAPCRLAVTADGFRRRVVDAFGGDTEVTVPLDPVVTWKGRVVDATTGAVVESFIGVLQREMVSGGKRVFDDTQIQVEPTGTGEFTVEMPVAGRFRVRILSMGYQPTVSLPEDFDGVNAPAYVDVVVAPAAVLEVTVVDAASRPIPGFGVNLVDWSIARTAAAPKPNMRRGTRTGRTNPDGVLRFNLGEGGSYRLARGASSWLEPGRVDVAPGPVVRRYYRLEASGSLEIHISDERGEPAPGASVLLASSGREVDHSIKRRLRPHGAHEPIVVDTLLPGQYEVDVRHRQLGSARVKVDVRAPGHNRVDVVLRSGPSRTSGRGGGERGRPRKR